MKETRKIITVFILAVLYSFVIGIANTSYAHTAPIEISGEKQDSNVAIVSLNLFSHATEAENSFYTTNYLPDTDFESSGTGTSALAKKSEQRFESAYRQYIRSSKNRLVSYRKEDLIFPFHYHW